MIDLSRLTHFVELARAGSFVRAAEELHLSQPARVPDADAAVALANSSRYGLGGTVFGQVDEARRVAGRLGTGGVGINNFLGAPIEIPFGGTKLRGRPRARPLRHGPVRQDQDLRDRVKNSKSVFPERSRGFAQSARPVPLRAGRSPVSRRRPPHGGDHGSAVWQRHRPGRLKPEVLVEGHVGGLGRLEVGRLARLVAAR
jgi:Aldehyde dehydrogenase family/Bacterial regulatory helix-turn-helix protein, lysR family